MAQRKIPAVYMRGGTSRCLVFHARDLPAPGPARDAVLLAALGSPDPYGRQLDGLGGGISSLSKAVIIGPTTHPGADVDYTFAQVEVGKAHVDYTGNCGNCSSAVGPFAIEERLIPPVEYTALDGMRVAREQADVVGRAISMGNCHRAFPLTSSMCLAVAARIEGTLVHECSTAKTGADVRLGHPSGVLPLDAAVVKQRGEYQAERVTVYRTARRLMEGYVRIP